MSPDNINTNIRLRTVWEAVDLGFAMVQEWWQSLYLPLAILTFGIAIPLFYFMPADKYWLAALIFWWLKPLYDRLLLHIISHRMFNDEINTKQALQALPALIWNTGFFQSITFRRFSLSRGFNLPIWQLEQLRGSARSGRQDVLHIAAHSQAVWLTIGLWLIEFILFLSLFALMLMFLPQHISSDLLDGLFTKSVQYQEWLDVLMAVFYVVVVTFIHPFYVAGNFALYINRRTQLEAWDIELDFRKMNQRFKKLTETVLSTQQSTKLPTLLLACLLIGILFTPSSTVNAEEPSEILVETRQSADKSKSVIEEVMLTENLNDKKKVMRWVKIPTEDEDEEEDDESGNWFFDLLKTLVDASATGLAFLLESLLWVALLAGVFLIYYFRDRWLPLFQTSQHTKDDYEAPEIMFGMDVRPDSLPEDIISEARQKWQQGDHRDSLSLLYRGALVRLINEEKIKLKDSHTEGDVLKQSSNSITPEKLSYLQTLTIQWQRIAYAHRTPDDEMNNTMHTLFDSWATRFAIKSNTDQQDQELQA